MLEIPSRIAISQLRPGIVLYYISTKAVILLELTCPCEKNIEVWLNKKFEKSLAMVSNGWSLHLFLTEVGGRGYFSVTRKSCLMRLRFSTSLVKSTLKSLSLTSSKASKFVCLGTQENGKIPLLLPSLQKSSNLNVSKNHLATLIIHSFEQ